MAAKAPTWEPPRPLSPATPMRMASLAPTTWPLDLVPAMVMVAAAARVDLRKSRRFWRVIRGPFTESRGEIIKADHLLIPSHEAGCKQFPGHVCPSAWRERGTLLGGRESRWDGETLEPRHLLFTC